ncbi:hypothetical protein BDV93DRAFT_262071 [Ceratobasidium sp. AG-I]|nr:hypothetical protein BDV93DRAFT_262071 [Ceratobasidium sp. AG-I]
MRWAKSGRPEARKRGRIKTTLVRETKRLTHWSLGQIEVGMEGGRGESDRGRDNSRSWTGGRGTGDSRGWVDDRERGRNRDRRQPGLPPPNANAPLPPPGGAPPPMTNGSGLPLAPPLPVDPKIEEALNDTIARVMREADEAEAKKKDGGRTGEKDMKDTGVKPKVLRRTAEQEMQAYGRKFVGTSQIRDYAIADKLGEGTFG